jgi:glycosyltransferase involved in cell wall biosynthesis
MYVELTSTKDLRQLVLKSGVLEVMKISIATVVRNDIEGFLTTAKSVLNQTYHNIEWIVIDGDSNDGTSDYVRRFSHRISHLVIEPDSGVYNAMNKAIDKATGEWLIFMNAADIFYENKTVEKFVERVRDSDEVVYGSVIGLEDGKMKFHRAPSEYYLGMVFDHQASFTKTELYKSFRYNENFRVSGDFDLFSRLRKSGHEFRKIEWFIVCKKPFENGISAGFQDRIGERLQVIKSYFNEKPWKNVVKNELLNFTANNAEEENEKQKLLGLLDE